MDDKGKELCPRLIDFLIIVGRRADSRLQKSAPHGTHVAPQNVPQQRRRAGFIGVSHPEILRRYPTDNHRDFELPTDSSLFCQPEGCVTVAQTHKQWSPHNDATSFIFSLTEKDSAKIRYGITLNFFLSCQCRPSTSTGKRRRPLASLTSLCLISHHPFLSTFRDLLVLLGQLIDAANLRCNGDSALARDSVWSVITGHWTGPIPDAVMTEIRQIEKWILTILSSPVPVPGKTKLQLDVLPSDILPTLEFALPDHTRFSLMDFPLHLPLELLSADTVLLLLAAIMLEHKIVLQSRNYNAVSICVNALVALLYPLEYMFPVIPLLPAFMQSAEQLLLAPTPFIIGIPASFFVCKGITLPPDVLLVDLDTNEMTLPQDIEIPRFPEPEVTQLKEDLLRALGKSVGETATRSGSFEANYRLDGDEIDVAARIAIIRFFDSPNIFANFSEHTRTLRLYPRPVVALQAESFLRSRPFQSPFISELVKTQSVEYFAESLLCPVNEAYVRVQHGTVSAQQIGDKAKWFADSLMPVHFNAYPHDSTLAEALNALRSQQNGNRSDEEDEISDLDSQMSESGTISPFSEHIPDLEASKPLGEVNDVYHAPHKLELPKSLSRQSMSSSLSSGRSSPMSSNSPSANDSEADFARLAENLAIKSNEQGDFGFDHDSGSSSSTPIQARRGSTVDGVFVANAVGSSANPSKQFKTKGEKVFGPQLMNTLNGYAEKSHGVLGQIFSRTAPKAQALRERTMRPLAEAAANQNLIPKKAPAVPTAPKDSAATAQQQIKNQQTIRETCDQILNGQGIGVFAMPKIKRLLEDESNRELTCQKLNLGLDVRYSEEDNIQRVQLTRAQFRGYVKILQACLNDLEQSYNSPHSDGLASLFHVLEIAHTHFWAENETTTPSSGISSSLGTPSTATQSPPETAPVAAAAIPRRPAPPLPPRGPPPPLPPRPGAKAAETTEPQTPKKSTDSISNGHPKTLPKPEKPKTLQMNTKPQNSEPIRHFLFAELIGSNPLWSNTVFWENAFYDMVAKERDIIGMDQEPSEMIDRYSGLGDSERKRLELDEDRILANLLHNMTSYMVMCGTPVKTIQQKIRRLLGKAHIGLIYSRKINELLDDLPTTPTNSIPLRPLGSRLVQKQSFTVHIGDNAEAPLSFMEVCDDAVILRSMNGSIAERWWYERLVNMTYSPRTRVLCIWRRQDDQVLLHKFHTKKCRQLYGCMKSAMERAAARGKVAIGGRDLGGEFPVHDIETSEGGLLQVRIDGIRLLFANRQDFIELGNIKKCNTYGGNMFVLEEFNPTLNELRQRRYISTMARQIAWALHRMFSVRLSIDQIPTSSRRHSTSIQIHPTGYPNECRVFAHNSSSSSGDDETTPIVEQKPIF